jgi:phosphatidylserine/phosphatidylglycerophosphate/cardiolipin synthase-like enzyme
VGCKPGSTPGGPDARLVCDSAYLDEAIDLIEGAADRISVTQFELFSGAATSALVTALGEAADRGIVVRVLLDDEIEDNAGAVESLRARGVDAKLDLFPDTTVHAKMLVADGLTALVGSTNWSTSSITRNHECNLRLTGGAPVAYVEDWFEDVWADASQRVAPDVAQEADAPVVAMADDALLPSLLARIKGARTRVDFTLYATFLQPTNPGSPAMQVYQALADAAARGVPVRGVAEWSDWQTDNNERNRAAVDWLEDAGIDMRWEEAAVITHAKGFLIDDVLQIQSANISTSGFARNHEIGARTTLKAPVDAFAAWFGALWDSSTDAPGGARR